MKNLHFRKLLNGVRGTLFRFGAVLLKHRKTVAMCAFMLLIMGGTQVTLATDPPPAASSADALWKTVSDLIGTWVTRLGGVVIFVGGIMFGLGWKNDDAEGKTRGVQTMIAGGIVTALAAMIGTFFA